MPPDVRFNLRRNVGGGYQKVKPSFVFLGSENKKNSLWNTIDMVCFT